MDSPKYNRTYHFPWSPGSTDEDEVAENVSRLLNVTIVITEKMDGSNVSLERDDCFARTHSGPPSHPSFDALKALHASVRFKIPEHYQLFGEWCFARHSIGYSELPHYLMLFNVRDSKPEVARWLSWDEVELWAQEIEVPTVPVLFEGQVSSAKELKELVQSLMIQPSMFGGAREGVVARVRDSFLDSLFSSSVLKCVRANHVQTSEHWKDQEIIKNGLR